MGLLRINRTDHGVCSRNYCVLGTFHEEVFRVDRPIKWKSSGEKRSKKGRAERLERPARPQIGGDARLVFVVVQALFQLVDGDICCANRFDTMAAEVVRSMFEVFFSAAQRGDGFADLRMRLGRSRGRLA